MPLLGLRPNTSPRGCWYAKPGFQGRVKLFIDSVKDKYNLMLRHVGYVKRKHRCCMYIQTPKFLIPDCLPSCLLPLYPVCPDEMDVQESQEIRTNLVRQLMRLQKQSSFSILLHIMTLDDTLKLVKLLMLQRICEDLELDTPLSLSCTKKKAPHVVFLKEVFIKYTHPK